MKDVNPALRPPGGARQAMTSVSAYPQKSFVTKKISRKSVTINEIIKDEHEHARHVRAERFHGKQAPKGKVRHSRERVCALARARSPATRRALGRSVRRRPLMASFRRRLPTATPSSTPRARARSRRRRRR